MKSIFVLWNSVEPYFDEIIDTVSQKVKLIYYKKVNLKNQYEAFTRAIYDAENMEKWKIDNKLLHMLNRNSQNIVVGLVDVDNSKTRFHEKKNKMVFCQAEDLKTFLRSKYSQKIEDYYFDIVFHMTDNEMEYQNCKGVLKNFDNSQIKSIFQQIEKKVEKENEF